MHIENDEANGILIIKEGNMPLRLSYELLRQLRVVHVTAHRTPENVIEIDWEEYWKLILLNEDGSIDESKLKEVLSNYRRLVCEAMKVYCEITRGVIEDIGASAKEILAIANRELNSIVDAAKKDAVDQTKKDVLKEIRERLQRQKQGGDYNFNQR